jgi:hypothetical protein
LALVGFSNTLAKEGAKLNIHCNAIAPVAGSRMTETVMPPDLVKALKPEFISPVVGYLCHDSCKANGELFELGGGWVARVRWQRSQGYLHNLANDFQPEDVAKAWAKVNDFNGATNPVSTQDAFSPIMENLKNAEGKEYNPDALPGSGKKPKAAAAAAEKKGPAYDPPALMHCRSSRRERSSHLPLRSSCLFSSLFPGHCGS